MPWYVQGIFSRFYDLSNQLGVKTGETFEKPKYEQSEPKVLSGECL